MASFAILWYKTHEADVRRQSGKVQLGGSENSLGRRCSISSPTEGLWVSFFLSFFRARKGEETRAKTRSLAVIGDQSPFQARYLPYLLRAEPCQALGGLPLELVPSAELHDASRLQGGGAGGDLWLECAVRVVLPRRLKGLELGIWGVGSTFRGQGQGGWGGFGASRTELKKLEVHWCEICTIAHGKLLFKKIITQNHPKTRKSRELSGMDTKHKNKNS